MKTAYLLVLVALLLTPGLVEPAERYIDGLFISIENWPPLARPGETLVTVVCVTNESENTVSGLLRTYVYGFEQSILYPPPDFLDVVLLNEGGWFPNEIPVRVESGESENYILRLKLKANVVPASEAGSLVRLRTRLRVIENGLTVNIARPDTKGVLLLPRNVPAWLVPTKAFVGILVGCLILISAKEGLGITAERHPRRPKPRLSSRRQGTRERAWVSVA
jgi:hypothetical protein